ncbi:MAG TPA: hypothetical protein VGR40_05265 [Candidatus Binatus sp.]|nr:hypothetical protein [Candidatus Binatus sp.]
MAILREKCYASRCGREALHRLRGLEMCAEHFREAYLHGADVNCVLFPLLRARRSVAAGELFVLTPQLELQLRVAIARVREKENAL